MGVLGWYGLLDDEGRLDLGRSEVCELFSELTAGNRDGTVPARARLVEFAAGMVELGVGAAPACAASKSGKLSLPGDSGIVSRRGVE